MRRKFNKSKFIFSQKDLLIFVHGIFCNLCFYSLVLLLKQIRLAEKSILLKEIPELIFHVQICTQLCCNFSIIIKFVVINITSTGNNRQNRTNSFDKF